MRPSPQGTLTQFEKPRGPGAQRRPRDLPRPLLSDMGFILLLGESASSAGPQWRLRPGLPGQGYRALTGLAASSRESPERQGRTPGRENL